MVVAVGALGAGRWGTAWGAGLLGIGFGGVLSDSILGAGLWGTGFGGIASVLTGIRGVLDGMEGFRGPDGLGGGPLCLAGKNRMRLTFEIKKTIETENEIIQTISVICKIFCKRSIRIAELTYDRKETSD